MRARNTKARRKRRGKMRKASKGNWGGRKNLVRRMKETLMRAGNFAFEHRKDRKGEMRSLWIIRINAAARRHGLSYSRFIHGLRRAGVEMDRKMLADIAFNDAEAFSELAVLAKGVSS